MKNKKTWIYGLLTILIGIIIFCFSAQPGDESGKTSGFVVRLIQAIFGEGVFGEYLHFLVRKAAHVTVYFLFGFCATCFWTSCLVLNTDNSRLTEGNRELYTCSEETEKRAKGILVSILLGVLTSFLYACSDEWHQTFVSGRSGNIQDVLIDGIGFVTAAAFVFVAVKRKLCYNKE